MADLYPDDMESEDTPEYKQYEIPPEEAVEFLRGEMDAEETPDPALDDDQVVDEDSNLQDNAQWAEQLDVMEEGQNIAPVYTYEEVQPAEDVIEDVEGYTEGEPQEDQGEVEQEYQPYDSLPVAVQEYEPADSLSEPDSENQGMEISSGPYQQYQPQEGSTASYQEVQPDESPSDLTDTNQPLPLANIFESYQEYQSLENPGSPLEEYPALENPGEPYQEVQSLESGWGTATEAQPFEDNDLMDGSYQSIEQAMESAPSDQGTYEGPTQRGEQQPEVPVYTYPTEAANENYAESTPGDVSTVTFVQQEPPATPSKKIALILSGGGARGAFQVGAELYARQVKGYHWDIIAGISVGAMNGAMLAMHRYERLQELWNTISDDKVYTGGFNIASVIKLLLGANSFYGYEPLKKMMEHEFDSGRVIDDLRVGAVSLISGEYMQFTKEFLELPSAILASASIPVIWPPVDISAEHRSMVDGGVRNNSPVGDVLDLEPDEIVIINCSNENPAVLSQAPQNVVEIGMRALDIMQNEIFVNDVKDFLRINALVKEAQDQGCTLHHPKTGRPLKYYPYVLIEPDGDLGAVLDFSQASVQASLKAGVRRAREVLGRP